MHSLILMMSSDFWTGYLLSQPTSVIAWHTMLSYGVVL